MLSVRRASLLLFLLAIAPTASPLRAQDSLTNVVQDVNRKLVKIFGAGGFQGLPSYGTGILVSPKGHILTVNNHILTSQDIRVHLYDGRFYHAKVMAREPELDMAVLQIDEKDIDFLPHFDFAKAATAPLATPGDWVLAMSNCFQIATRDEPMTVQRGVISALADLHGRRGVFEAPFSGNVYFIDTVANNPGSAGGALTNRQGELIGILGRELKNTLTDTWINYAIPVKATVELVHNEKTEKVSMADFVREAIAGMYREGEKSKKAKERGGFHGIVLVPNVVSVTPPYVEEVVRGSPAEQAGLKADDLIVYVDGELVQNINLFNDIMSQVGPGTEVRFDVQRGNRIMSMRLNNFLNSFHPSISHLFTRRYQIECFPSSINSEKS